MRSFSISYQVNGKYTVFCGTCACPGKDYAVGPNELATLCDGMLK